jgi:hypothetical protein
MSNYSVSMHLCPSCHKPIQLKAEVTYPASFMCEDCSNRTRARSENIVNISELQSKITELGAKIEKMKCCGNCKHENESLLKIKLCIKCILNNFDHWEIQDE